MPFSRCCHRVVLSCVVTQNWRSWKYALTSFVTASGTWNKLKAAFRISWGTVPKAFARSRNTTWGFFFPLEVWIWSQTMLDCSRHPEKPHITAFCTAALQECWEFLDHQAKDDFCLHIQKVDLNWLAEEFFIWGLIFFLSFAMPLEQLIFPSFSSCHFFVSFQRCFRTPQVF